MKNLWIVASFTIKEALKRKSLIISTIVILLFIVVGFNVPKIVKLFGGDPFDEKVLVIDEGNLFEGTITNLNEVPDLGYTFEVTNEKLNEEQIKAKLEDDFDTCIKFYKSGNNVKMEYIVENAFMNEQIVSQTLISTFTNLYSNVQITKLNITSEQIAAIEPQFDVEFIQTGDESASGNIFIMMMVSLVLFYAIVFCAQQVSTSITTEKTSKIIETLVTSTDSKTIVLGKTLGIGIIGLVQLTLIIVTAVISANVFMDKSILEGLFDLQNITPKLGIITLVYFLLGYTLYSLGFALVGSTVSKPEDVQSANGPISIIAVIGFYLSYFSMMNPTSSINKISGLLPISSPFSMPLRIMMGIATTGELIASLAILLATACLVAFIAVKVYSATMLNTGSKISLKQAIKMSKEAE